MKKLLVLLAGLSIIACSGDDDNNKTKDPYLDYSNTYKFLAIRPTCDSPDGYIAYCVTDEEYNRFAQNVQPCTTVTITDVDGNIHTGIFNGGGSGTACYRTK